MNPSRNRAPGISLLVLLVTLALSLPVLAQEKPERGEGGKRPPPPSCKTDADCVSKCPPSSKGCTCHTTREGDKRCAPTCQSDEDCPSGRDGRGVCKQGICRSPRNKAPSGKK